MHTFIRHWYDVNFHASSTATNVLAMASDQWIHALGCRLMCATIADTKHYQLSMTTLLEPTVLPLRSLKVRRNA